jgi:hypothetical protein
MTIVSNWASKAERRMAFLYDGLQAVDEDGYDDPFHTYQ